MTPKDLSTPEFTLLKCVELLKNDLCGDVIKHLDKHPFFKSDTSTDSIEKLLGLRDVLRDIWQGEITDEDLDRPFKGFESGLEVLDNGDTPRFELTDSKSYDLLKCSLKIFKYIHSCPIEGVFERKDTGYNSWENKIRTLLGNHYSYLSGVTMDSTLSDKWKKYLNVSLNKSMDLLNEFFKGTGRIEKDGNFVITGDWDEGCSYEFIHSELSPTVQSPYDMFIECFDIDVERDTIITPNHLLEEDLDNLENWTELVKELENYSHYRDKEVRRFSTDF